MNNMLLNFFENNVNHKKLRESRLKRKLSIDKVSDMLHKIRKENKEKIVDFEEAEILN